MKHRLFVRDFGPQADVLQLESLFSNVGTVRSATLQERATNSGVRQVAYIEMSSAEEVHDCIIRFHGAKFQGFILTVTEDKPHIPDPNFRTKRATALETKKRPAARSKKKDAQSAPLTIAQK